MRSFANACFCLLVLFIPTSHAQAAEPSFERHDVFVGGQDGCKAYRLPSAVVTRDGTLLVFCDGRMLSLSDFGKINPVVRRSTDGGRTFSEMRVLDRAPGKKSKIGNGCPFYDRQTDTVHFLYMKDLVRAFLVSSTDGGKTFGKPREITSVFKEFDFPWKYFATGHVHGIQTTDGRLVLPVWLSNCPRHAEKNAVFTAGILYSEDHAKTFQAGGRLATEPFSRLNESTVFECADGSLCYNARERGKGFRVVSRSTDNGKHWSVPKLDKHLPDPTCQASSLVLPSKDGSHRILFCNPAGPGRTHLTVRLSDDDGRVWSFSRLVDAGHGAYCDMAADNDGTIYVVYETGRKHAYEKVALARFNLAWLTEGRDTP